MQAIEHLVEGARLQAADDAAKEASRLAFCTAFQRQKIRAADTAYTAERESKLNQLYAATSKEDVLKLRAELATIEERGVTRN